MSSSSSSQSKKVAGGKNECPPQNRKASSAREVVVVNDGNDTKINSDGIQVSVEVLTLVSLTAPLRVHIFNYLGQRQDELINLTLLSKQFYKDCQRPGIDWKIISTIEIRAAQHHDDDSIRGRVLMQQLFQHLQNNETKEKLQCYPHMRIKDVHKFNIAYREIQEIARGIKMDWILSLEISSPLANTVFNAFSLALSMRLPNLHELNFSNSGLSSDDLLIFSLNCPLLKKFTWNNNNKGFGIHFSYNLKEIHMNHCTFCCLSHTGDPEELSDLENHIDTFIFYLCCKSLERVSIRNAKWYSIGDVPTIIPQNALIKFVRSVPSLCWFRSDLTQENMDMLRLERPDIELLN
jgi:hypothetical protein